MTDLERAIACEEAAHATLALINRVPLEWVRLGEYAGAKTLDYGVDLIDRPVELLARIRVALAGPLMLELLGCEVPDDNDDMVEASKLSYAHCRGDETQAGLVLGLMTLQAADEIRVNVGPIAAVAAALLEREWLNGDEVVAIVEGWRPEPEPRPATSPRAVAAQFSEWLTDWWPK